MRRRRANVVLPMDEQNRSRRARNCSYRIDCLEIDAVLPTSLKPSGPHKRHLPWEAAREAGSLDIRRVRYSAASRRSAQGHSATMAAKGWFQRCRQDEFRDKPEPNGRERDQGVARRRGRRPHQDSGAATMPSATGGSRADQGVRPTCQRQNLRGLSRARGSHHCSWASAHSGRPGGLFHCGPKIFAAREDLDRL
jgi:hypothetical protein